MFADLKSAVARNPAQLAHDLAGAAVLVALLVAGLTLPGLV